MSTFFYAPYLPVGSIDRMNWLVNFATAIPPFATKFNLLQEELLDIHNSAMALSYARVGLVNYTRTFSKAVTSYADQLDTDATPSGQPYPAFTPSTPPPVAQSGIFKRMAQIINVKILPTASDAEKIALGLVPLAPVSTVVPEIMSLDPMMHGQVGLTFRRGGAKMVFIYSMRAGEQQLSLLDKVAGTHYVDTRPNANLNISEVRNYAVEWSTDGIQGDGKMSLTQTIATLA